MKIFNTYFLLFVIGVATLTPSCAFHSHEYKVPMKKNLHENWVFAAQDDMQWRSAEVPGVVHTDLIRHGVIPDPWFRLNEKDAQWVENKDWVYKTTFEISKEELNKKHIVLTFEGLDTYAEISLNGKLLANTDNMFLRYDYDVRKHLKVGKNELIVKFQSPINKMHDFVAARPYVLPAPNEPVDVKVSPYVRKAPYHFGWDWGPRLVTSGIWRPVYLKFYDEPIIRDVQIHQKQLDSTLAIIDVEVDVFIPNKGDYELQVGAIKIPIKNIQGEQKIRQEIRIEKPNLWWPYEWGTPYLYSVEVRILEKETIVDQKAKRFGLRTIELVQEPDELGETFYFKVNGQKFFMRGANYIPQSNFLPSVTDEQYRKLIEDTKAVNINTIRVWGGGIYENDIFYDLCDEQGILVWQDFMFACSMYPGDEAFLENVRQEAQQNILRLRNHPSIAHWNGNNEVSVAWTNWGWQKEFKYSETDSTKIFNDYLNIFERLIPNEINKLDSTRSYSPTSPMFSFTKLKEFKKGPVHYWGVWHAGQEFDKYAKYVGRFMAEWGFQSFPNMETIKQFSTEEDWDIESEVMKWHQKSYIGNDMILKQGLNYFKKPKTFEEFVAFSQRTQALAMRAAIDAHRLAHYNGGTIYWQLNDCWPAPSWSTRDVYGNWKEAHTQLSWLYAPLAILPKIEDKDKKLELVALNDLRFSEKVTLTITQVGSENKELYRKEITIKPSTFNSVWQTEDKSILNALRKGEITIKVQLLDESGKSRFERTIDQFDFL
jgi:beta-mannosidase